MKKILGIVAALVLCAATASASPMTVTTGPPDGASATIGNSNADIGVIFTGHNDPAGDINVMVGDTAIFMGDEIGLLKGPCTVAGDIGLWMRNVALSRGDETSQDEVGFIHNAASNESSFAYTGPNIGAMGVSDLANAGKTYAELGVGNDAGAAPALIGAEVIRGAPPTLCNTEVRGHNA